MDTTFECTGQAPRIQKHHATIFPIKKGKVVLPDFLLSKAYSITRNCTCRNLGPCPEGVILRCTSQSGLNGASTVMEETLDSAWTVKVS